MSAGRKGVESRMSIICLILAVAARGSVARCSPELGDERSRRLSSPCLGVDGCRWSRLEDCRATNPDHGPRRVIDDTTSHHPAPQRHEDTGADGRHRKLVGHAVSQAVEGGDRHRDANEAHGQTSTRRRRRLPPAGWRGLSSCLPRHRACDRDCAGETPGGTWGSALRRGNRRRGRGAWRSSPGS